MMIGQFWGTNQNRYNNIKEKHMTMLLLFVMTRPLIIERLHALLLILGLILLFRFFRLDCYEKVNHQMNAQLIRENTLHVQHELDFGDTDDDYDQYNDEGYYDW